MSSPARVADPAEGVSEEELQLAARNAGMPLEALRYEVTPAGLHYLLIHYDIPALDPAAFRLTLDGTLRSPAAFTLDDLRALPAVTSRVTIECAGNGRARLHPRPVSQPWLVEAVGTAEWTGTPLAPLLDAAGLADETVAIVFTGADHGIGQPGAGVIDAAFDGADRTFADRGGFLVGEAGGADQHERFALILR